MVGPASREHRGRRWSVRPSRRRLALTAAVVATSAAVAGGSLLGGAVGGSAPRASDETVSVLPERTIRTLIGTALTITRGSGITTGSGSTGGSTGAAAALPLWTSPPDLGFTSPLGVWHLPVTTAPLASNSKAEVADLLSHLTDRYGGVAAFNAHQFPVSFVTAPAGTATTNVAWSDCQGLGWTPAGLLGPGGQFTNVPIPAGAVPAAGTDNELSVYSPSTDQLWEFWEAQHTSSGWSACWGGRIDHVSTSQGIFGGGFGSTATGLAAAQGMVSLADVRSGHIDHAVALAIPSPAIYTTYSWPAQRSDGGSTSPNAVPEGTHLRLDPTLDIEAIPGLTPIARMIAHAAQTYGFIVTDQSGAVAVTGQSGAMEQAATGVDPWAALEGGVPDYLLLQNFPWSSLQALPKDYGRS